MQLSRESIEPVIKSSGVDGVVATRLVTSSGRLREGGTGDTRGSALYKATDSGYGYGYYGMPVVYGDFEQTRPIIDLENAFEVMTQVYETRGASLVYTLKTAGKSRDSMDIVREDILGVLYRVEEQTARGQAGMTAAQFNDALEAGRPQIARGIGTLEREGKLDRLGDAYALTDAGRGEAQDMIRAHRLWESYLEQNLTLPVDHLHAPAERLEHITDEAMRQKLAEATAHPEKDPQGKTVPR